MKTTILLLITSLVIIFMACNLGDASKEADRIKVDEMYQKLLDASDQAVDNKLGMDAVQTFVSFAEKYPEDSMSAEYYFMSGKITMNINQAEQSIDYFEKIVTNYPNTPQAALSIFMQGFVYETKLMDNVNAEKSYQRFIEKYPNHEFADDAQISIQQLGIPPEELIKQFEMQARADSLADSILTDSAAL